MDLEHDERLIDAHAHFTPAMVAVSGFALTALLAYGVHPGLLLLLPLVILLVSLAAAWTYRRVHITDRRVVEFRPALAALARRLPALTALEVGRRRVIPLDDIFDARAYGNTLVLRTGQVEHHLHVHDAGVAVRFGITIAELARRRMAALARRKTISVRVEAQPAATSSRRSGAQATALRCPYCHDALAPDEVDAAAECGGCGALHHAECFAIHRGCSASGCGVRDAKERARLEEGPP